MILELVAKEVMVLKKKVISTLYLLMERSYEQLETSAHALALHKSASSTSSTSATGGKPLSEAPQNRNFYSTQVSL